MKEVYILTVTGSEWLSLNDRGHWGRRNRLTEEWRVNTGWAARSTGTFAARGRNKPLFERIHVIAVMLVANNRIRDPHNFTLTAKACVDGLVDVGVVKDDSAKYLDGPDMRLRVKPGVRMPTLELHVTPIHEGTTT